jgi:hypothetical protein
MVKSARPLESVNIIVKSAELKDSVKYHCPQYVNIEDADTGSTTKSGLLLVIKTKKSAELAVVVTYTLPASRLPLHLQSSIREIAKKVVNNVKANINKKFFMAC